MKPQRRFSTLQEPFSLVCKTSTHNRNQSQNFLRRNFFNLLEPFSNCYTREANTHVSANERVCTQYILV